MVAISYHEIINGRPLGVMNSLEYLERFWNDGLESMTPSVQPVLTKAFEGHESDFDLLITRDILAEQIEHLTQFSNASRQSFVRNFANNLICFDEYERPIPTIYHDQTTKVKELRHALQYSVTPILKFKAAKNVTI